VKGGPSIHRGKLKPPHKAPYLWSLVFLQKSSSKKLEYFSSELKSNWFFNKQFHMVSILITFLLFVLILVSLFLVLVVLMQRASSSGGLGAAFGGGVAESAFGADTGNVLTKLTIYASASFFVLSLGLYLLIMSSHGSSTPAEEGLPLISVEETSVPAVSVEGFPTTESAPAQSTAELDAEAAVPETATEADANETPAPVE
jgi:preprotein translocase subunit SecG